MQLEEGLGVDERWYNWMLQGALRIVSWWRRVEWLGGKVGERCTAVEAAWMRERTM